MAELELAWVERDNARLDALREAAHLLESKLTELARRGPPGGAGNGCVHCEDMVARRLAAELRARAGGARRG